MSSVVGGLTPDDETDATMDVFDARANSWSKGAPLPGGQGNAFSPAVCAMDGRIFASPADGNLYRLEESGAWTKVGSLQHKRIVHRMVPDADGRLLVLGGASREGNVAAVEGIRPKS
jgi:hypothetical protein